MEENHKKFLNNLDNSSEAVFISAFYLHKKGLDVKINAMKKAESHQYWKTHKDDGDMYVYKNDEEYRVEVKGLSADFTCAENWPFGAKFLVCAKHSYDQADIKPYAYMLLNKERTHMAIVRTSTKDHWYSESRSDSRYDDYTQEYYLCPINKIEWLEIENSQKQFFID